MRLLMIMAFLTSLTPSFGATTWPVSTNAGTVQTLFGSYTFARTNLFTGSNNTFNGSVTINSNLTLNAGFRQQWFDATSSGVTNTALTIGTKRQDGVESHWFNGTQTLALNKTNGTITASNFVGQVTTASYTPFVVRGTNVVISPTNGNLQTWTLTNASWIALDTAVTNFTETIRLNIWNSNTVTWAVGNLSNYTAGATRLGLASSALLFDHMEGTNLWWCYRLR